jgi:very-short-patch-repair endonuclease
MMPRGQHFTPEHQRRAGQARAADRAAMAAIGRQGAESTIARYGFDFLMRKLTAYRRRCAPTDPEAAVLAQLARWGLVEGEHYERNLPVTVHDPATGQAHTFEIDIAVTGLRAIEADGGNWHGWAPQAAHDAWRDALLAAAGWEICRLPGAVLADPDRVRAALVHFFRRTGGLGL